MELSRLPTQISHHPLSRWLKVRLKVKMIIPTCRKSSRSQRVSNEPNSNDSPKNWVARDSRKLNSSSSSSTSSAISLTQTQPKSVFWSIHICILIKAKQKAIQRKTFRPETRRPWLCLDKFVALQSESSGAGDGDKKLPDFWLFAPRRYSYPHFLSSCCRRL